MIFCLSLSFVSFVLRKRQGRRAKEDDGRTREDEGRGGRGSEEERIGDGEGNEEIKI